MDRKQFANKFTIVKKSDSRLMSFIDFFLFIISAGHIDDFMTKYVTTIRGVVYVPDNWERMTADYRYITLRHELVHIEQSNRYTFPIFALLYLAVPFPFFFSSFRVKFEMEAYEETIRAMTEVYGILHVKRKTFRNHIISQFTGPHYMWMAWRKQEKLEDWYDSIVRKLDR